MMSTAGRSSSARSTSFDTRGCTAGNAPLPARESQKAFSRSDNLLAHTARAHKEIRSPRNETPPQTIPPPPSISPQLAQSSTAAAAAKSFPSPVLTPTPTRSLPLLDSPSIFSSSGGIPNRSMSAMSNSSSVYGPGGGGDFPDRSFSPNPNQIQNFHSFPAFQNLDKFNNYLPNIFQPIPPQQQQPSLSLLSPVNRTFSASPSFSAAASPISRTFSPQPYSPVSRTFSASPGLQNYHSSTTTPPEQQSPENNNSSSTTPPLTGKNEQNNIPLLFQPQPRVASKNLQLNLW